MWMFTTNVVGTKKMSIVVSYLEYISDWDKCVSTLADMFELAMATSLLEIQRNELASWQVRKLDGVCILPDLGWLKNGRTVSFLRDLGNAIKMMGNVPTSMILPRSLSAQSF